jgi:hypothetical protein
MLMAGRYEEIVTAHISVAAALTQRPFTAFGATLP